ncbi:hypothetical protein GCM10029992_32570 [Glycomyces albus]
MGVIERQQRVRAYRGQIVSPGRPSITDLAASLDGGPQPKHLTISYARPTNTLLRPPLEYGQFTSNAFRDKCFAAGVIPSVGRTGSCFDNAQAEALNATIKKELIHSRRWTDLAEVRAALFEYIEIDYNRDRIHQGLGYLTPIEFEALSRIEFTEAA